MLLLYLFVFFFFFQAEDGIRDGRVTGVQTCALPICFCGFELTSPDREQVEGTLDLDGDASGDDAGRRAAAVLRLGGALRDAPQAPELWGLYEDGRRPLRPGLAAMEEGRGRPRPRVPRQEAG